ncbi:coiled-coil domain-containing protein 62 isoform X1 [Denticeps clupeoides]|uniref:coiled-coil domain-containing protein 62 isoform X1 n=1 Tax=Denticeps clupeoides TaxID=299321 RepID=UPI0010A3963F|nr:coiled-coil domain-containing protein 62 isoform X1 [Denticeps clupeoides]
MDGDGGDDRSSRLDSTSNFSQLTNVIEPSPWHSTPLKKSVALVPVRGREGAADQTDERLYHPQLSATLPTLQESELDILETSAIQKQRREMQALIAQVKEAEQELTTTLAAQQKRQKSWEQDHQRVLALEQKCARLKDELSERNEIIKEVTKRMKELDLQERDGRRALRISQNKLHELKLKQQLAARQQQDLEVGTRSLNSTIMALSSQIGQLQVREEELSSMLKLKDNDVIEATNHILDLSGRIGELESSILESQTQQNKLLKELKEYKHDSKQTRREIAGLKEELQEKTTENSIQREELIRLKQENQLLRRELVLTGEGENWKDELLSLARSKQQRLEAELHSMQKVCEIRENDLTLLRMKLDNHQETPRQSECQRSHCRRTDTAWDEEREKVINVTENMEQNRVLDRDRPTIEDSGVGASDKIGSSVAIPVVETELQTCRSDPNPTETQILPSKEAAHSILIAEDPLAESPSRENPADVTSVSISGNVGLAMVVDPDPETNYTMLVVDLSKP